MKKFLLSFALLVGLSSVSYADFGWISQNGSFYQHEFLSNGAYWTWNGGNYTRQWYPPVNTLSGYGCYTTTPGYYLYTPVQTLNYDSSDATIEKAIAARDAVKNKIVADTIKHQQFIEKIKTAHLDEGIGYSGFNGAYNQGYNALVGTFGINSSAIYGYNQASLAQVTNPFAINLDQALLTYGQLVQGHNDNNAVVFKSFGDTVNLAVTKSADISGINARKDAILQFARTLDGPPTVTTSTGTFTPRTVSLNESLNDRWNRSANTSCVQCHTGNNIKGNFDVSTFPTASADIRKKVLARLEKPATDPEHMPPKGNLSLDEYRAWVEVASLPTQVPAAPAPVTPPVMPKSKE